MLEKYDAMNKLTKTNGDRPLVVVVTGLGTEVD